MTGAFDLSIGGMMVRIAALLIVLGAASEALGIAAFEPDAIELRDGAEVQTRGLAFDPAGALAIPAVVATLIQDLAQAHPASNTPVVWMLFTTYASTETAGNWTLDMRAPNYRRFEAFKIDASVQRIALVGSSVPLSEKSHISQSTLFTINARAGVKEYWLIRYESLNRLVSTIFVKRPMNASAFDRLLAYSSDSYQGVLIAMILYNLLVFFQVRDRRYVTYVGFVAGMLIANLAVNGYLDAAIEPLISKDRFVATDWNFTILFLPPLLSMKFARQFLDLRIHSPRGDQILRVAQYLICTGLLASFLVPVSVARLMSDLAMSTAFVLCPVASVIGVKKRLPGALVFLIGWGVFDVLAIVWFLGTSGFIHKTYFVYCAAFFGNSFEMIFMSLALGQRYKSYELERNQAQESVKQAEATSHLLRVLCHDVLNPMNVIQNVARMVKAPGSKLDPSRAWEKVNRAATAVTDIVDHVRTMESLKSGKLAVEISRVSIAKVFENAHFIFADRAAEKGVGLEFDMEHATSGDVNVKANPTILSNDVLHNLISNAIKFSRKGDVVTIRASHPTPGSVTIAVSDRGIGIPVHMLSNLFSFKGATSRKGTAGETGTGFGMPIVKTFLERMNGTIEVTSRTEPAEDSGTTVTVVLPAA